jgi:transcriptional regulator with XRE-family HTH domain
MRNSEVFNDNGRDSLKRTRKKLGLTQHDVARIINVNQSVISRIETGEIELSPRIRDGIEEAYGIQIPDEDMSDQYDHESRDVRVIKSLLEKYAKTIPETGINAIRSYVEHVIGLSEGRGIPETISEIPREGLWGTDWSWGPRELDRFIVPECARHLKWNRISIHRTYPVFIKGRRIDKTEVYVDGYSEEGSTFSGFIDHVKDGGIYTAETLPVTAEMSVRKYFQNVISVKVLLPGPLVRIVYVLMSGDDEYDTYDYYFLDGIVRKFLEQKGELNYGSDLLTNRTPHVLDNFS